MKIYIRQGNVLHTFHFEFTFVEYKVIPISKVFELYIVSFRPDNFSHSVHAIIKLTKFVIYHCVHVFSIEV